MTLYIEKEKNTMKHIHKFLSLALALVLCLSLAACGSEDGRDDNDNNFYNAPNSLEGLVKDSEQMSNLYVFGGAWRGEDGETLISATSDAGDEVRFALYNADEEVTASGFSSSCRSMTMTTSTTSTTAWPTAVGSTRSVRCMWILSAPSRR